MMEHRHTMSYPMAAALRHLYGYCLSHDLEAGANLKVLGLTRNQWDNFQKLRYWGLVERIFDAGTGRRLSGYWRVTELGKNFLGSRCGIPRTVWTYRGEFVRAENNAENSFVFFDDITDGYKLRSGYAQESQPHQGK